MKNIRQAIRSDEVVLGVCCDSADPAAVEVLGSAGWDFVLINTEGGTVAPFGTGLANMIRAAYKADVVPVVKVPANDAAFIATALKLGAKVIEVPMVNSRADAEDAVRAVRYPPAGNRMTYWGVPATGYGAQSWGEHVATADDEVTMYAVLEEPQAMERMEDILSAEGLEMVILGVLDLALRLGGVDDERARARVAEYRRQLYRVAADKGVAVIDIVGTAEQAREAVALGARGLLFAQDDHAMLRDISRTHLASLRAAVS